MHKPRPAILISLGLLTILFLAAGLYVFFHGRSQSQAISSQPLPLGTAPGALRLTIDETGIAAVTQQEVRDAGLVFESFAPAGLSLTRDGQPIPFAIQGEGRDATLYFYAQAITSTTEAPAVYWLAPGVGINMDAGGSDTASAANTATSYEDRRWETNTTFLAQASGHDLWLGQLIFAPSQQEIPLDDVTATGGPGILTVRVWANNQAPPNPDHHLEILLNGAPVADQYWEGITEQTIEAKVPAGLLRSKDNVLTLSAPGDTGAAGEQLYLDWIALSYESSLNADQRQLLFAPSAGMVDIHNLERQNGVILDITTPDIPRRVTQVSHENRTARFPAPADHQYAAANPATFLKPTISLAPYWETLKDPSRGARYVAIVADLPGFAEAVQPLLDYRQQQGLSVAMIPVSQIYDEFAYGRQTPQAIRDFLAYAVANWNPAPHFVLLAGDATYDLRDFSAGKNRNLIPTYLVNTTFAGYVASDTWYTLLSNNTLSPSLAIGRLPAQTPAELQTMVEKTISYETGAAADWSSRALLVADDEPNFSLTSDRLSSSLATFGFQTEKLYMEQNDDTNFNKEAIIGAINNGVGILNYVGHGSIEVWGDEKVLRAEDAATLINYARLPIFTTFTCLNGYFNHPQVDALAETLLWTPGGGIVAAVAPSGRSTTTQQTPLADEFYGTLLNRETLTLGEALQAAKVAAAANPDLADVIHTFNLLGDPALHFQHPHPAGG